VLQEVGFAERLGEIVVMCWKDVRFWGGELENLAAMHRRYGNSTGDD
jgi:hypothetical protein